MGTLAESHRRESKEFAAMDSKPTGGWQFVNISEPKKDDDIRRMVRANAMRYFRKKQKQERQASSKVRGKVAAKSEATPLDRVNHSTEPSTSPEPRVVQQTPEDEMRREDLYPLWPDELSQTLGNLDTMSLGLWKERYVRAEELVQTVDKRLTDPSRRNDLSVWEPDGDEGFGRMPAQRRLGARPQTLLDAEHIDQFNYLPGSSLPGSSSSRYNAFTIHHCERPPYSYLLDVYPSPACLH